MFALGWCYEYGTGIDRKQPNVSKKQLNEELANALFILAQRYENGDGIGQCYRLAALAYKKAAQLGHPYSYYKLGLCYYYAMYEER